MNPEAVYCPTIDCPARDRRATGNISVHSQAEGRYYCTVCQTTLAGTKEAIFYQLKTDATLAILVIPLLAYECPIQAIGATYGVNEWTVKNWWQRAGAHC